MHLARSIAAAALLVTTACAGSPEEGEVVGVLGEVVSALEARDAQRLWALSDEASRTAVLEAIVALEQAQAAVPLVWAQAQDEARLALGAPLVAAAGPPDAGRGPRVLAHLVDLDKLSFDGGVMDGLGASDVLFEPGPPERAIVHTSAGESFGFVREGGVWRSLIVRDLVVDHPHLKELLVNAKKTDELRVTHHKVWQASRDPRTPQGAYNVARTLQAATPLDGAALFGLLEPSAQAALGAALDTARLAQKRIQGRLAKAQRAEAYSDSGIALHVAAQSDKDLYVRWSKTAEFVKPLSVTDDPDRIDGDVDKGDVRVVTVSGKSAHMVRDAQGFWRIGDTTAPIEELLVSPAKKILEAP